jgi:hypothetical protein
VANGDSKVTVKVVGDAAGLSRELGKAEKDVGAFSSKAKVAGAAAAAGFLVAGAAAVEFGQTALAEADRAADASQRLDLQIGALSGTLKETAGDFAELGQSRQDILELEAAFADFATTAGLADAEIASMADEAAATAAAIELLGGADAATNIDLIGKAADGSEKAMKALGINISKADVEARALRDTGKPTAEALNESERAAAAYKLVLEALAPKLTAVAGGQGDTEQKAAELAARWETLTGQIGESLEPALNDLLGQVLAGIDGWAMLGGAARGFTADLNKMIPGIEEAIGQLRTLLSLSNPSLFGLGKFTFAQPSAQPSSGGGGDVRRTAPTVNINVQPRDGADTERAVVNALRDYDRKNGGYR